MEYPFPHIEHKIYKNTFIQTASVTLIGNNEEDQLPENFEKVCSDFTERFFQIKPDFEEFRSSGVLLFSDDGEEVAYAFHLNKARLTIGRKNYKSFLDNVMPGLLQLKQFMFSVG